MKKEPGIILSQRFDIRKITDDWTNDNKARIQIASHAYVLLWSP